MAEVFRFRDSRVSSLEEAFSVLEKWRHMAPPGEGDEAVEELEAALRFLKGAGGPVCAALQLGLAMTLGNLWRERGQKAPAMTAYLRGLEVRSELDLKTDATRNELANLLTQRAILLLEEKDGGAALLDLDEAIRLRETLPLESEPVYRWGLAAGWINRGDALRLESRAREAVASYDHGLEELESLEPTEWVRWRRAVAWNNRGLAWKDAGCSDEAHESFEQAVVALAECEEVRSIVTREAARLQRGDDPRKVLEVVSPWERTTPEAAKVSLQARHAIACGLCERPGVTQEGGDWIAETTDWIEEGLEVARAWETVGDHTMRPVALDLFRVGLRVYRVCQPQFLAEFVLESLDPEVSEGAWRDDPDFQASAVEALALALKESLERGVTEGRSEKELAISASLRAADERLAGLQQF
ncbi:tetratricopeptide (TPR) repeat protein [Haloferula luteola]|uniref:Tetratricopeptide (TPR) repeat protein n=1 Tax=Haloferula luteola TaxID=595692 RepID=A0A840V3F1_9BACT|nr:hypothetical protein [Haloferula luteola]MBB5352827.1 tetratricopeptide (TPR) repeat protein [Haloferula luteola]